jgi:hypothetical protein|uniref:Uncharacterized protein n=1 Tax=viral metagenome TaxID=1070528 RepID=A0A6C0J1N1_9ZZZZ
MENTNDMDKKKVLKKNIISIVMYCLSMTIALMFNDLITSMFDSYVNSKHVIVKANFLVILFGIAIYTAVYLNSM